MNPSVLHSRHMKPHASFCPPSRAASQRLTPLTTYLTGAVGSTILLAAPQAEAAVTSITFGFGSVLDITDGSSYTTPTTPSFGTIPRWISAGNEFQTETTFRIGEIFSQYGHFYQQGPGSYGGFGIGLPTFLANGTIVGGGGNGALGMAYFSSNNSSNDLTADQLNQNLGFKTSTGNWGWANVSWDETAKALTFHEAYVESVVGNTITVGDVGAVPEPSRALLALAGLGGVALRRRRKLVA